MIGRLTAVQNFGFLIKMPMAESLTPVQVFCFLVIYALLGWVGFLPPCCHVLFYGSMIMVLSHDFGVRPWFPVRDFRSSVVEGLCNFMARIPDKIRSIDGSKETLKLAVRITDLWFVGTPNKSEQAEMVFVDSEGDQIHAICKSDHLKSWKADLKENCTYVMHNFKVVKNDGQFRVCEHEYKLFFIGVTVVREADLHELPFKEFRFVEFANVVAGNFVSGLLVGEYSHNLCFHFDHNFFGVFPMTYFHLWWFKILLGSLIRWSFNMFHRKIPGVYIVENCIFHFAWCLCLSYPYEVMDFLSYLNERGDDGPMVIILTNARIKDAQGSYPALVSNSFKASKLLINDPILEIQEFKERLRLEFCYLAIKQAHKFQGGSQLSSKDSFLSKDEAKTILEINAISEYAVCVTVGTISKIVMDNHSWCYPACAQCHRKTDIQIGPFTCGCGKDNDQPVLRYRVEVMDRECAELIGQTAYGVNRVKIEDGDLDLNASPQALDKLLGHVLAFKVRIQSRFKNVVVLKYSKDLDLINVVLEMLPDSEQFLSATVDHDPVEGRSKFMLFDYVLSLIPNHEKEYCSADSIDKSDELLNPVFALLPPEFLYSLQKSGWNSNHAITKSCQTDGLCNGTRLIITKLGSNVIEAEVITGPNSGNRTYISRINMSPSESAWSFKLIRRQFSFIFPRDTMDSIRFTAPFRVQKNLLQVPFTYHRQWLRNCPKYVLFHYDGEIHFIRVRTLGTKCFFADGLNDFRRAHNLHESVILRLVAGDKNTTFTVHIDGPAHHHSNLKPIIYRRRYTFTVDITDDMLQQNLPLTLPASASKFVYGSKKSITIHHGLSKSTKWPLTIHHDVPAITQPWFNLIHEKNLKAGDEVVFYYRFHDHAWELLIRKAIEWNNSNTDPDSDD
ncbi:hypothetical protein HKD37_16G045636 [Glycine soja]